MSDGTAETPEANNAEASSDDLLDDGLDPFRDSPVGTNDPNIVGDVGPFDVPPGQDPETDDGGLESNELP